ncbi:MAG: family 43 glycosylhydrolase [Prevotellaceae bacterium]|jgi:hypothetical protein|nr:family 43 glycosylhydrolase [Prevotellaceae bacterium]
MKKIFYSCLLALFSISLSAQDMPVNPFIRIDSTSYILDPVKFTKGQPLYTADPSARVFNGRLYVYPSHDMEPAYGCDMMDRYHVFSTDNMVDWTDHGEIFNADSVPWGYTVRNGGRNAKFMWAPDCAEKDGKYYYYFPHPYGYADREGWDNWRIGIAISDYPDRDFKIQDTTLLGLPTMGYIDPHIFKDDDGQYYFYYGGSQRCFGGKLKDNMLEIDGSLQEMDIQVGGTYQNLKYFHEGAWVFKRNGIYYMTYPGNNASLPNYINGQDQLLYAVSDSPLGPWTFKGSYLSPEGCDTSHGSVVEFNGQWYAFYHNNWLSKGQGNLRSICVDKLFFDGDSILPVIQTGEDRKIETQKITGVIQAENFKNGGEGVGYHDSDDVNTGGSNYRLSTAVDIANSSEGLYVTDTRGGEWLAYDTEIKYSNVYRLEARVASNIDGGKFRVEIDGTTIATVEVPNTGGLNKWKSVFIHGIECQSSNNQTLKIAIDSGGFNLNYLMFTLDSLPPIGKTIVIQQGSYYVTLTTSDMLRCNRSNRTPAEDTEKFVVVDGGDDLVAFKSVENKFYIGANTGDMSCISFTPATNNKFVWCFMEDTYRTFSIKSANTNKVVWIDNNDKPNRPMQAKSDSFDSWETFTWYDKTTVSNHITDINTNDSKVSLYPNPAENIVTVTIENSGNADIQISDLQGKIVLQKQINQTETNINISGLSAGLYLVNVVSDEFNVVKKLVIN